MPYQPIENYGMIGDMHTVALVGINGSIDWLCVPDFDSPSVFGGILDDGKGGHFIIEPVEEGATCKQFYWPETNVLVTRFLGEHGSVELVDFMPVGDAMAPGARRHELIRMVNAVRGTVKMRMTCRPAFNYARDQHTVRPLDGGGVVFVSPSLSLALTADCPIGIDGDGAECVFQLEEGNTAVFVLSQTSGDPGDAAIRSPVAAEQAFRSTVDYWRAWLSKCTYRGRWREMVQRSALALKLMTYEPTGAIVAAPTCSLPEGVGGERNWDYRFTWIRDSAFVVYAFLKLGFTKEAERYMHFAANLCRQTESESPLQIMYGIRGETKLVEQTLDHLDGYRQSRPVRIGNGAYDQLQLDITGELMDAAYLFNKYGQPISYDLWSRLRTMVDWVCANWTRQDEGIWEVRGGQRDFVYSKVMCWVALDRGLRLAEKRSFPCDRERWQKTRDVIYEDIMEKGWNEERGAFTQAYDNDSLDASNLMMTLTFFVSPTDPRMLRTLDAIMQPPSRGGLVSNNLVFRYNVDETDDGLAGEEGTFNICTFWLVEALTRCGRFKHAQLEEARLMFERMLGFANHLGLYAEETGHSGEHLGNFPQAFTHLSLISAAINLDRALGVRR